MKTPTLLLASLLALAPCAFAQAPAAAPAPAPASASAAPAWARVAVENPRLRVIAPRYEPGEATPMHEHPPRVVIALTEAALETTAPDGTTRTIGLRPGAVSFQPATKHAVKNVGPRTARLVEIELLTVPPGSAIPPAEVSGPTGLDNALVSVTRIGVPPGGEGDVPAREHVRVILTGERLGDAEIVRPGSAPLRNEGRTTLYAMIVEPKYW